MKEYTMVINVQLTSIELVDDVLTIPGKKELCNNARKHLKRKFGLDDVLVKDVKIYERDVEDAEETENLK